MDLLRKVCYEGIEKANLDRKQIVNVDWKYCTKSLKIIGFSYSYIDMGRCSRGFDTKIKEVNFDECPSYLERTYFFLKKLDEYTKTEKYFMKFYGKKNLEKNIIKKELKNINIEIVANSYLCPTSPIKVFNSIGYKENFYNHVKEMKELLKL